METHKGMMNGAKSTADSTNNVEQECQERIRQMGKNEDAKAREPTSLMRHLRSFRRPVQLFSIDLGLGPLTVLKGVLLYDTRHQIILIMSLGTSLYPNSLCTPVILDCMMLAFCQHILKALISFNGLCRLKE